MTGEQFELFGLFILASWFQGHVEVCEANNVWAELVTFKEKVPHVLLKYGNVLISVCIYLKSLGMH